MIGGYGADPVIAAPQANPPDAKTLSPVQPLVLVVAVLAVTFGLTATMDDLEPIEPVLVAGVFVFLMLVVRNGSWMVHGALVALFMTAPIDTPQGLRLSGIFVYFYEMLILGALFFAVKLVCENPVVLERMKRSAAVRVAGAFVAVVIGGVLIAVWRGNSIWNIQFDVKPMVEMLMVVFICIVVVLTGTWRQYVPTLQVIIGVSAALAVYASATGFELAGRSEAAELYAAGGRIIGGGSDAVRLITQTTPLALAVMLGLVACALLGKVSLMHVCTLFLPSMLITVLSFSRNTLLALAGAVVFSILIAISKGLISRVVLRTALIPVIAAPVIFVALAIGNAVGAESWIDTQVTGYENRVFAGLSDANERVDNSASYRDEETMYISKVGARHPIFGGGFGTAYKPPGGERGSFFALAGTLYTHNFYNWLYLKVGIIGLGTFAALVLTCVTPALRRGPSNVLLTSASAVLVGLCITISVAPLPIDQPGSAMFGIVFGLCIAGSIAARGQSPASSDRVIQTTGRL